MSLGEKSFSIEQARGSVNVASQWAHSVNTGKGLDSVLTDFQKLVSADTVQVVRQMRHFDRTRIIARQAEADGKLFGRPIRSFASAMLGDMLHKTHCGTLFLMTALLSDSDTQDYLEPLGLRDVGIVSLSNEDDCTDFLEFHFNFRILDHDRQILHARVRKGVRKHSEHEQSRQVDAIRVSALYAGPRRWSARQGGRCPADQQVDISQPFALDLFQDRCHRTRRTGSSVASVSRS